MYRGSFTALVTPFRNGQFDRATFEKQIEFQAKQGTNGIIPVGTTGESPTLSHEEHHRVVKLAVEVAKRRVPVIAGASSNNTQTALELARSAERAGASAILAVTPFYLKPSQAGIVAHFRAIHDAVGIPVILYDVPARTGVALDDVTVKRLAGLPRIAGLKDATGDIARVGRLRRRLGQDFLLLSGDDSTQAAFRLAGGDGCISVTANVVPALCAALQHGCDDRLEGDIQWYEQVLAPLHAVLFLEANPIPLKRALFRMGQMGDGLRLPLTPLSPEFDRKLGQVLDAIAPVEEKEARRFAAKRAA